MGKPRQTLKALRAIALEHVSVAQPDLASMARDLGQILHRNSFTMATRQTRRRQRGQGVGCWPLARLDQPTVSVMVTA